MLEALYTIAQDDVGFVVTAFRQLNFGTRVAWLV